MKRKLLIIAPALAIIFFVLLSTFLSDYASENLERKTDGIAKTTERLSQKQHIHRDSTDLFLELPATCFAPDTEPSVIDEFYRNRQSLINSLGFTEEDLMNRFNLRNRWTTTALDGGGLGQGDFTTLTWSYVPDGTPIGNGGCGVPGESTDNSDVIAFFNGLYGAPSIPGDFTTAPWHQIFVNMFDSWSEVSGLTFVYEPNDDGVTVVTGGAGVSGTRGDFRISGHALDGNSGVLACNYFPENGDMIIDTSDNYYENNQTVGTTNVLTHEIGHGLGIFHVCPVNLTKLMEPTVTTAFQGPQEDDILATNRFYGDPEGANNTPVAASALGANPNPTTYTKSQRSIDDNSDIDYYSFTVSETSTLTATLTPTGTTYLDGVQNANGSCSSGSNFDALTVTDLMIDVLDTNGTSVLATADSNGPGVAENLLVTIVASGTYYVRVQQQGAAVENVQMYDLELSLEEGACITANIPANIQASSITDSSAQMSWDPQSSVLYDLRYRESGTSSWINISDLVSSSTTLTGLTELTEYEVQVRSKCAGDTPTAYSSSVFFTTEDIILVYCDASANNVDFLNISRVKFNTVDNSSANNGYTDYTDTYTLVTRGSTHLIEVFESGNTVYTGDQVLVWIDFNKDGDFTDAGEQVITTDSFSGDFSIYPFGGNITIPSNAALGETRMRIRIHNTTFGTPNATPCGNSTYGEVEDYAIVIYDDYVHYDNNWTPQNPTGVSTAADNVLIVDGAPNISGNISANDLRILGSGQLNVEGVLEVGNNISNDGNLIFKSDAAGSGQLDVFTGTITGSGEVSVERFIPAGNNNRRAYRLLTSALNSTESINANWQEGVNNTGTNYATDNKNPNPGYGTHITGGAATLGFDQNSSGNASMFTFNNGFVPSGSESQFNAWTALPNTNSKKLKAGEAYLTFVRGDRSIDVTDNSTTPTNTTLRAIGSLQRGNITFSSTNNSTLPEYGLSDQEDLFSLVGNPYQAIVDINNLDFTNINSNAYWVWDPNLGTRGNYTTVSLPSGANTSSSPANQFIQPGQSFFVQTLNNAASSLVFNEDDKAVSGGATAIFSQENESSLKLLLYTTAAFNAGEREADGLLINFSEDANNAIDVSDADKLQGPDESLARLQNNELISIEHRAMPVDSETLTLSTKGYTTNQYTFVVNASNIQNNFEAYLMDNYTGELSQLNEGSTVLNFTVDTNIPESIAADRFSIVFDNTTLGISDNSFGANFSLYPNPTEGQFSIKTPNLIGEVRVIISNLLGQKVLIQELSIESQQVNMNAGNLSAGTYIVELHQNKNKFISKLIVK